MWNLKKTLQFALPLCLLVSLSAGEDYQPMLTKLNPPEKIIVVDVSKETKSRSGFGIAAVCMQGLINRNGATKVYLTGVPIRVYGIPKLPDDPRNVQQMFLDDGLIPFPRETAELDEGLEYPGLSYLVENFGHLLSGKVAYAGRGGTKSSRAGGVMAAVNVCTFESALPVTPEVDAFLQAQGIELKPVVELPEMDNIEATRWSMARYLDHPKLNQRAIGFGPGLATPAMLDYWVATHSFVYMLRGDVPEEAAFIPELLNADNFPQGIPNMGPVEGVRSIDYIEASGYSSVCGEIPNASLTSSIPTQSERFVTPPKPKALPIDPNGAYIAFNGPDGDAMDFCLFFGYLGMRNDPALGKVPVGLRINPYAMDLFPSIVEWYTKINPDLVDVIPSMNDGGFPLTDPGADYWNRTYDHYIQSANGNFQVLHFLGTYPDNNFYRMTKEFPAIMAICGYQGGDEKTHSNWLVRDNDARTVYVDLIGRRGEKYAEVGDASDSVNYELVRQGLTDPADRDRPLFMMVRFASESGMNAFTLVQATMDRLNADPSVKRTLYFVPPRDLAATYRAWADQQ